MRAIEQADLICGNLDLVPCTEHEGEQCRGRAEKSEDRHPPDMPDQSEAGDHCEERGHETDRTVLGHFNRLVRVLPHWQLLLRKHALLLRPEGIDPIYTWQDRKIPGWRWRRGGPLQGAAVPRIARRVAQLLAVANGHHDLDDLTDDSSQDDECADLRHQQPGLPSKNIRVLQTAGHSHQSRHVERHESEMEANEPAPERRLAPALIQPEAECLRKPVIVASHAPEQDARDNDVMEMGNQEDAVVDLPIDSWQCQ